MAKNVVVAVGSVAGGDGRVACNTKIGAGNGVPGRGATGVWVERLGVWETRRSVVEGSHKIVCGAWEVFGGRGGGVAGGGVVGASDAHVAQAVKSMPTPSPTRRPC